MNYLNIVVKYLMWGFFKKDGWLRMADHGLCCGYVDIRICTVLQQRYSQGIDVIQVGRRTSVHNHVHQRKENVLRPLREANVGIQPVLK